jgi:hypothetical protein
MVLNQDLMVYYEAHNEEETVKKNMILACVFAAWSLGCFSEAPTRTQNGNKPPQFILPQDIEIIEGFPVTFVVSVSEPDGDRVTTAAIQKPQASTYSDSSRQFVWQTTKNDRGSTKVIFSVTDGHFTVFDTVGITVKAQVGRPPVFAEVSGPFIAYPGQQYTLQIRTTNPTIDSVTVAAVSYPAGAQCTAIPYSGTLVFRYTPAEKDTGSSVKAIFSASTQSAIAYDTMTIQVARVPKGPIGTWTVTQEGMIVTLVIYANQTFSMNLDTLGSISGTWTESGNTVTMTPLTCTAFGEQSTDCGDSAVVTISGDQLNFPSGDGTSIQFTRASFSTNRAPVFAALSGPFVAYPGQQYSLQVRTINPAADSVTVAAVSYPAGAQCTAAPYGGTLVFKYTPAEKDTGSSVKAIFSAINKNGVAYDTITISIQRQASGAVGTWTASQAGSGMSITFKSNNTYTLLLTMSGSELYTENGTFIETGNTVVMTCVSCTILGMEGQCSLPVTGTISGSSMTVPNDDGTSTTLTKAGGSLSKRLIAQSRQFFRRMNID